ncbi:phospholipase D family protein [Candidatus Dependentiae bacterium]|nr:phospholipase D family protein [Candidatus Dependentiae bacterium]
MILFKNRRTFFSILLLNFLDINTKPLTNLFQQTQKHYYSKFKHCLFTHRQPMYPIQEIPQNNNKQVVKLSNNHTSLLVSQFKEKNVELIFPSATTRILDYLLSTIDAEKKLIIFAAYTLTHLDIIRALKAASNRGVFIEGIVDINTLDNFEQRKWTNSTIEKQLNEIKAFLKKYHIGIYDRPKQCMHHKLFLFGANGNQNNEIIITGSANPSNSGLNALCDKEKKQYHSHNPEGIVIIKNERDLWQQCKKEIEYLQTKAKEK